MVEKCSHHWDIETTNEPIAKGQCRKCGIERRFNNGRSQSLNYREEATLMFSPRALRELLPDFAGQKVEQGSRLRMI